MSRVAGDPPGPDRGLADAEIAHTQAVYATSADRGRIDELLDAFVPTGVLEFGEERHEGHDAIRRALVGRAGERAGPGERRVQRHHLTTRRIEYADADTARAWTYFLVTTQDGPDHAGVYVDRFTRRDRRWLLTHRRVKLDWIAPTSTAGRTSGAAGPC